jgi:flagellar basal body P-ring formation protein FlgA
MKNIRSLLVFMLLTTALSAWGQPQQNLAEVRDAVTTFINEQTRSMPGQVTIKVGEIDPLTARPACPKLEVFLPAGAQLLGNSTAGVRCLGKSNWTLFIPFTVRVSVNQLIANKPLKQGDTVHAEDISTQNGELAQTDILTDPQQAVGKIVKFGIGSGQVLKQSMLRAPFIILRNQTVHLLVEGSGFNIQTDGTALNDAAEGQAVEVKTSSGQKLSGIARADGSVIIAPSH